MRLLGTVWPTRHPLLAAVFLNVGLCAPAAQAQSAYVRVSQVGYEAGQSARAYLMSTAAETGPRSKCRTANGEHCL